MKKKKEYKVIENNIEYLVVESFDFYYLNKYHSEKNYSETYIKFVINLKGKVKEVTYLKDGVDAFIRYLNDKSIASSFHINGKCYFYEDWLKLRNKILRKDKLNKIKFIYT